MPPAVPRRRSSAPPSRGRWPHRRAARRAGSLDVARWSRFPPLSTRLRGSRGDRRLIEKAGYGFEAAILQAGEIGAADNGFAAFRAELPGEAEAIAMTIH